MSQNHQSSAFKMSWETFWLGAEKQKAEKQPAKKQTKKKGKNNNNSNNNTNNNFEYTVITSYMNTLL